MAVQVLVKLVNVMLVLQGLVIVGGAAYIASVSMSSFVYVLGGVGLYTLVTGVLGLRLTKGRQVSHGCASFYAVLLFVLLTFHTILVVGFLAFENRTISILQDLNSGSSNDHIRSYLDAHKKQFKWAALSVLIIEFLAFCVAICCTDRLRSSRRTLDDELDGDKYVHMDERGLVSAPAEYGLPTPSATPQTDARRAALNEKYGGLWEQRRTTTASTSFSTRADARV
jgi:hypothetical protein